MGRLGYRQGPKDPRTCDNGRVARTLQLLSLIQRITQSSGEKSTKLSITQSITDLPTSHHEEDMSKRSWEHVNHETSGLEVDGLDHSPVSLFGAVQQSSPPRTTQATEYISNGDGTTNHIPMISRKIKGTYTSTPIGRLRTA